MIYLVTGGTGFLGERLIERLLNQGHGVVTVARNEGKLIMLKERFPQIQIFTGDISNQMFVRRIMQHIGFEGIFHLAAFKHVGLAEEQVNECIKSNIEGTISILNECIIPTALNEAPKFVIGISTDKAAQVSGVYGATKLIMERLFKSYEKYLTKTQLRIVRYGNVLYSTGSVLCKWKKLIEEDKEIIVTDPEATRFFWTRDQAIDLIFECLEKAKDSSPYVTDMKAIRIQDLVEAMFYKYRKSTDQKLKIKRIGLQPGENMHEKILEEGPYSNEVEQYTFDEIVGMI